MEWRGRRGAGFCRGLVAEGWGEWERHGDVGYGVEGSVSEGKGREGG